MADLGTLGGTTSIAQGVSSSGTIVGWSFTASGAQHAFSYSGGIMTDLGTLGGTSGSVASGINSAGTIVGSSYITGNSAVDAFIDSGGVMTDLNTLLDSSGAGWTLIGAQAINDNGQIVGYGTNPLGQSDAFLLTLDVPEPSACTMLVGGLGLLGAVIRRRRVQLAAQNCCQLVAR